MNDPVDHLRSRLRELGYLDAGVDRFVLGGAAEGRGLARIAAGASVRIGLLAALLLGPSAALALGARLPGLAAGPRDLVVLSIYLALFFGVSAACAAFAVSVLLGTVVGRPGAKGMTARAALLARIAGVVTGAACLVYLVLWWRTVSPEGAASLRGGWTLLVLAWTAAVSVLLGHAVSLTTSAIIARRATATGSMLRLRPRSRLAWAGLAGGAFLAAAALLFVTTLGARPGQAGAAQPVVVRPTGVRLTLIALDGVDIQFLERLRAARRLPSLGPLLDGSRARMPASDAPDPARTWTSLATGQPAEVHGISGIEARRVSGLEGRVATRDGGLAASIAAATDLLRLTRPVLTTALQRRSKTFWEVAAEQRLSTLVVNWWASWPAEGPGIVLSDRSVLRLERGGGLDAEITPASLYERLRGDWPRLRDQMRREIVEDFPGTGETAVVLRRAAEQDALPVALAALLSDANQDLQAIYLPGLDIAQHELIGRAASLPASVLASRIEAVERYYVFLDRLLQPLLRQEGRVVALVTDPGRAAPAGGQTVPPGYAGTTSGADADLEGLFLLHGSRELVSGSATVRAERIDVLPTVLYALGVPVSDELPGRPVTALFTVSFVRDHPPASVGSYGRRVLSPRRPGSAPLDQEMLERLRSLGYVR